jgi:hypothetical protein
MKKFLLLLVVVFLLPASFVHAQLAVVDAGMATLMTYSTVEQVLHYAATVKEWAETALRFEQQLSHWKFQVERALQNMASAQDIESWSDFTSWYNRQLYYERRTIESFQNSKVNIGGKNYNFMDIEGMAYGFQDTYIDYWDKEFTEDQRRAMWLQLGMTPSNYAFVQPFRQKGRELAQEFFFASDIQNDWYTRNMERNNERQRRLAEDKHLDVEDKDKLTEKEILMNLLESSMENNIVLNDIAMFQAKELEMRAVEHYLDEAPADIPPFSDWPEDGFRSLSN